MPLFGHRRHASQAGPVASETPVPPGWQPVPGRPFDGHLEQGVHEVTMLMYGLRRSQYQNLTVGDTRFYDVFRTSIEGRAVTVANARTSLGGRWLQEGPPVVAVCAVELPSVLPVVWIRPRKYAGLSLGESRTGVPSFDDRYQVIGMPAQLAAVTGLSDAQAVLTPEVQQRIMAHDDWVFHAEHSLLGCITKGAFGSPQEISTRVGEVMGIVAAIPASVLPAHMDHSADDLVARLSKIDSVEGAIAMLQQLTPGEREQLARSDTPLAAFADVQTPEEAMARFGSLDAQRRMQIIAMFTRAEDR